MPNPPIQRFVRWNAAQNDWDLDENPAPRPNTKWAVLLPVRSGAHDIVFHLVPVPGFDYAFECGNPILAVDNTSNCPPAGAPSDQIAVQNCQWNRLTISDQNAGAARLIRYQLNFIDRNGGAAPPACDPAILNGGGGNS